MLRRVGTVVVALSLSGLAPSACHAPRPPAPVFRDTVFRTPSLTAILRFPARYDSTKSYPLLVALHGYGGTAANLATAFTAFATESLVVAMPQAEFPGPAGGTSWFYRTGDRSLWDVFDLRSVNTILELVSALRERHRVGKVFILGFSQGTMLAYMTGLLNPPLVSGVLAIGGYPPDVDLEGSIVHAQDIANAARLPLFIAHGTRDVTVGRHVFLAQRDFFASKGYAVTAVEYDGGHTLTAALMATVRQWLTEELRR
jgi:phospholipase/carboxylesterase